MSVSDPSGSLSQTLVSAIFQVCFCELGDVGGGKVEGMWWWCGRKTSGGSRIDVWV